MFKLTEENVSINGKVTLKGTLSLPEGKEKSPAILFIHGSGPTDRDESVKGMAMNAFKELAETITSLGFATLRYDKRGVGESEGSYLEAGLWDLVDDAEAALNFLKQHPRVDSERVILLGHSEGCSIAPAVNKRQPVQGLILLAGAAESIKEAVIRQGELAFKELEATKGFQGWLLRTLKVSEKGRKAQAKTFEKIMNSDQAVMRIQFQKINAKWMREHFAYNVITDLPKVTCPTIAITGSKDVQVQPEDTKKIAELVQGPAEYHIINNLNHLLRKQEEPVSMVKLKKIYKKSIQEPVDSELKEMITDWLKRKF